MEAFALYQNKQGLKIFPGNKDTFTEVENLLDPPIRASRVRIIPFSYHPRTVCMRVELRGCFGTLPGN
jgi:discoidin domain receptor family protein 2